jgi:hypothetical protein
MSYSRRELYAFGEPLGECVTTRKPGGGLMCGGGGGGSTANTTNTSTENTDNRISQQGGAAVSGNNNTLTVLDGGAIKNAFDFAGAAQASSVSAINSTAKLVSDAYADAKGQGSKTNYIILGAVAVTGLVAVFALRGKK